MEFTVALGNGQTLWRWEKRNYLNERKFLKITKKLENLKQVDQQQDGAAPHLLIGFCLPATKKSATNRFDLIN